MTSDKPTQFPELNEPLQGWVETVSRILDANFVGAYLLGSFARGGADAHSDCDFLVVLRSSLTRSQEARWTLRERGVVLSGPSPKGLVDRVDPEAIREKMRQLVQTFLPDLAVWIRLDSIAWAQRYAVATLCRMLYSIATGEIASKRASLVWAKEHLDPVWSDLIQHALEGRHLGWDPTALPSKESIQQTVAFAEYARAWAQ